MTNEQPNSLSADLYEERFVAFVDILGFRELVLRGRSDPDLRARIVRALRQVRSVSPKINGQTLEESDLRVQNFSDSLIASAKPTAAGLWHLLHSLEALAWNLLNEDVLIRGGVAVGGIHHDDEVVFGEAVIEAFHLESSVARHPRIILSAVAVARAIALANGDKVQEILLNSRLRRDDDGVVHLHIFLDYEAFNRSPVSKSPPGSASHPLKAQGSALANRIQFNLDRMVDKPDIYAKLGWLAHYWNETVVGNRDESDLWLGRIRLPAEERSLNNMASRSYSGRPRTR